MVLRPSVSLKLLHHKGKIDILRPKLAPGSELLASCVYLSMYNATLRLVIVGETAKFREIVPKLGMMIEDPMGAAAADAATVKVIIHFVRFGY
jgi:hypothetical protein